MKVEAIVSDVEAEALKFFDGNRRVTGQFKRFLGVRRAAEKAVAREHRKRTNSVGYSFSEGHYAEKFPTSMSLSGVEEEIDQHVKSLLPTATKPVVVFDFGGGLGLSMIKIAANNRAEIEGGKLVIGVSNLGYIPSSEPDNDGYTKSAKSLAVLGKMYGENPYTGQVLDDVEKNQSMVAFVDAGIEDLPQTTFSPLIGASARLSDGVDVVHEKGAIEHTHTPDMALGIFGSHLNPAGKLFLSAQRANYMHFPSPSFYSLMLDNGTLLDATADGYQKRRGQALEIGISLLQTLGYEGQKIRSYLVFS